MAEKKLKVVKIKENRLVELIDDIVERTIAERNLVPATKTETKTKKVRVTESQLKALKDKGVNIKSVKKIDKKK